MFAQQGFALLVRLYLNLLPVSLTGSTGVLLPTTTQRRNLTRAARSWFLLTLSVRANKTAPLPHILTFPVSVRLYCPVKNVNELGQTRMRGSSSLWLGYVGPKNCSVWLVWKQTSGSNGPICQTVADGDTGWNLPFACHTFASWNTFSSSQRKIASY